MNNHFTAAQAREAAEKGNYEVYFVLDETEIWMLDRMTRWLAELGYSICNVGLYTRTFPLAWFCEYNVIRPSTIDKLNKLGYDVQTGKNKLEVHWGDRYANANSQNEMHGEHLLTAWDACFRADKHNIDVVTQLHKILDTIRDKSVNEGLFEYTTRGDLYSAVCSWLEEFGYEVTKLGAPEYNVKISWRNLNKGINDISANEYQEKTLRTAGEPNIENGLMGLCGESGECIDILKKATFQGHELDKEKLKEELGDVAWYLAISAKALGFKLSDIFESNIEKLKKRYPDGFSAEKSINREE